METTERWGWSMDEDKSGEEEEEEVGSRVGREVGGSSGVTLGVGNTGRWMMQRGLLSTASGGTIMSSCGVAVIGWGKLPVSHDSQRPFPMRLDTLNCSPHGLENTRASPPLGEHHPQSLTIQILPCGRLSSLINLLSHADLTISPCSSSIESASIAQYFPGPPSVFSAEYGPENDLEYIPCLGGIYPFIEARLKNSSLTIKLYAVAPGGIWGEGRYCELSVQHQGYLQQ
ncbi:hypothetical protein CISG_00715 [Coccidioides immitis RMSCC 3703]|uniref:Uncharacterized protein n=1 Tax=Coccidioides immitis RMSCC 3703 TaxID=454286 RepID=A0A0J8QQE4_COCIT|nr:hypothetical protein CISG_00715 [Coccidioides immitis RMSCC 3703]